MTTNPKIFFNIVESQRNSVNITLTVKRSNYEPIKTTITKDRVYINPTTEVKNKSNLR